jgi:hypothetical protein
MHKCTDAEFLARIFKCVAFRIATVQLGFQTTLFETVSKLAERKGQGRHKTVDISTVLW